MSNRLQLILSAFLLVIASYTPFTFAASEYIEEIIVTAQKREQNLQDTPISVTAFTGDVIEALGFRQSVDITAQTPNFSVGYPNGDTGVPAPFIRGVGLNSDDAKSKNPILSVPPLVSSKTITLYIFSRL